MIRYKKKERRVLWRTGRVIEDGPGMATLRKLTYRRSGGKCECVLADPTRVCTKRVTYWDSHLHHIVSRARGGSDELYNLAFVTRKCHRELTGEPQWTTNWLKEWTA